MRVLVTGATGFVGHHLTEHLRSEGHDVVAVGTHHEKAVRAERLYYVDLLNQEAVGSINFNEIDAVCHLAGLAAVGPSFDQPMRYVETNAGIQINLFERCLEAKQSPRFLIISSGSLYNPSGQMPLKEDSPVLPSSPYAVSKLAQETLAEYYQTRGFEVMVARPFNHIGPGQNEGFLVPDLAKQIVAAERGSTDLIKVGNLEAKRDYTDVRDIVRAYRLILEAGKSGQIYNVCSGQSVKGDAILNQLGTLAKIEFEVTKDPAKLRPSDAEDIYGSFAKLEEASGWRPEISLEQTLEDVLNDWRERALEV